jgi:hypothetical protein
VLLLSGVVALVLGGLALYARHAVLDTTAFADRASATLGQDEVRAEIVARITEREIEAAPGLAPRRPAVEAAVDAAIDDPGFSGRFHAGAEALHRALFAGEPSSFALPGLGRQLQAAGAPVRPADPQLLALGGGQLEDGLVRAAPQAQRLAPFGPLAVIVGLVLLAGAGRRAATPRLGARRVAVGLALAGGATVAATTIGRAVLLSTFDTSYGDAVVGTIWDAFLGDLRVWGLVAGAVGLIAAAVFEPGARGAWQRTIQRVMAPRGSTARFARAGALLLLAVLLLWMPEVPLDLALVASAGVLVFAAAAEVVRLTAR